MVFMRQKLFDNIVAGNRLSARRIAFLEASWMVFEAHHKAIAKEGHSQKCDCISIAIALRMAGEKP